MNDLYIHQLEIENKQLREVLKSTNEVAKEYVRIENYCDELKNKIDKAIELAKIRIESCDAGLSNDETSIVSKHSLLRLEIQSYKELLEILEGKNE